MLSGLPRPRVASLIQSGNRAAIDALYRRTGLPPTALPAFRAIVEAMHDTAGESATVAGGPAPGDMVERVLTRYRGFGDDGADEVRPLLGRLAAESRRARARRETGGYFRAA